jgi:cytoskeletal protein CcmA (bactofilin family)
MPVLTTPQVPSLGRQTQIKGRLTAAEDVFFLGVVEGLVDAPAHRVTVGLSAQLTGDVTAREVVVYGTVHGNVAATERIEILHQGKVMGDILSPRLLIEDGAYIQGSIDTAPPQSAVRRKRPERAKVITEGPSFMVVGGGE